MTSSMCSVSKPMQWISVFVILSITFASFVSPGVLSLLFTALVVIVRTILFTLFSKKTPVSVENFVKDEPLVTPEEKSEVFQPQLENESLIQEVVGDQEEIGVDHIHDYLATRSVDLYSDNESIDQIDCQRQPDTEAIVQQVDQAQEEKVVDPIHRFLATTSADLYSETESIDDAFTSEESDMEWPYSIEATHSPDVSTGSISDEESLIEIALSSGQYVCPNKDNSKFSLQHKLPYFSRPEAIFSQHGLMELFAEFNEEENLIEIDISMGSIKCSRFEIEA